MTISFDDFMKVDIRTGIVVGKRIGFGVGEDDQVIVLCQLKLN